MANIITRRSILAPAPAPPRSTAPSATRRSRRSTPRRLTRCAEPADRERRDAAHAAPRALRAARRGGVPRQLRALHAATGVQVRVDFVGWEDINQQTAVTANTGAGPDIIIGFNEAPHLYADKVIEVTDVAEYLGKKYGGWGATAQKYGKRHNSNNWIGLPFGGSGGPLVWRKSAVNEVGFQTPPNDHAGFLDLCRSCAPRQQARGLRARQRGRRRQRLRELADVVAWRLDHRRVRGRVGQQPRDDGGAEYLRELYPTFVDGGTVSWGDISNNQAYAANACWLTSNGVSLYFALKNDPATRAIAEDTMHNEMPHGKAPGWPNAPLTLNAMVFRHSRFPNAAKAFLMFMLEAEQYEPWLNANLGYWAHPLMAYRAARCGAATPRSRSSATA
jgi:multiple sugar transport system substrate-binding protein